MADRQVIVLATWSLANQNLRTAVAQVLCVGMSLGAVTDNSNRFSIKYGRVGVAVVVDLCWHGRVLQLGGGVVVETATKNGDGEQGTVVSSIYVWYEIHYRACGPGWLITTSVFP